MKALALSFIFAAGFCLGAALPVAHYLDNPFKAVVILSSCAGFFVGGAVALIGMKHPSTIPLPDQEDR